MAVFTDNKCIWFFRRNKAGRMVPAEEGRGFDRKTAFKVLKDLQEGVYAKCDGSQEHNPPGDHYIACIITYEETKL